MIRQGCIGYSLKDEHKPLSEENKIIAGSFKLFAECPQCKQEKELNSSMFTDNTEDKYGSMCGWAYKCTCGKNINIWEGAFDSIIDSFYEAGFVEESEEDV